MAKIIDHDSVQAFQSYNERYISENPLLTKLLSNCLDGIFAKKIKPIDGFNIASKGGHLVVLITDVGICLIFGNNCSSGILEMISERIQQSVQFHKMCVAGSKNLIEELMRFNKLTYTLEKFRIHYQCKKVNVFEYASGKMTYLDENKIELYTDLGLGLSQSYNDGMAVNEDLMRSSILTSIKCKNIFQWVDNNEVCSICRGHIIEEIPTIDFFYTPESKRGLRYGTSLVHKITSNLLRDEVDSCFLTADGNNPKSNSIFQKIGYQKISEYLKVVVD